MSALCIVLHILGVWCILCIYGVLLVCYLPTPLSLTIYAYTSMQVEMLTDIASRLELLTYGKGEIVFEEGELIVYRGGCVV